MADAPCRLVSRLLKSVLLGSVLLGSVLLGSVHAEDAAPDDEQGVKRPYRFELHDGTRLLGDVDLEEIVLETEYGRLAVPIEDVFELRMAERMEADESASITGQLQRLGDSSFAVREDAQKQLARLGRRAASVLEAAAADTDDLEVRARIEELLADMAPSEGDLDPFEAPLDSDELITRMFTARGRVGPETFHVRTPYGELDVARRHLARIVFRKPPRTLRVLQVTGENSGASFLDSRISVEPGDRVKIDATGGIFAQMWSARFSPDGDATYGTFSPGIPAGALICKVGDKGDVSLVGSSASLEIDREGTLRFAIALQDLGGSDTRTGEWKVLVTVLHPTD